MEPGLRGRLRTLDPLPPGEEALAREIPRLRSRELAIAGSFWLAVRLATDAVQAFLKEVVMTQTDISDSTKRWLAAACGFGMVALLFAAVAAQSPAGPLPAKDGPIAAVIAWGAHRQALLRYTWLGPSAILLFLLFVLFLARLAEPHGGTASTIALTGAVLLMAVDLLNHTLVQSLAYAIASGDVSAATTIWAQIRSVDHIFHVANPVVFGGLAFLVLRTRVLPAVFGVVVALLTVADLVIEPLQLFNRSVEDAAILPAFALTFWVLAASVFMVWTAVRIGRPS